MSTKTKNIGIKCEGCGRDLVEIPTIKDGFTCKTVSCKRVKKLESLAIDVAARIAYYFLSDRHNVK